MRIARFSAGPGEPPMLGMVRGRTVTALSTPRGGDASLATLLDAAARGTLPEADGGLWAEGRTYDLDVVTLHAPVGRPGKFLGVGLNYADHTRESGLQRPETPVVFTKQSSCVTGPGKVIVRPLASEQVDYEGELGVVIGRRCRHLTSARAWEAVGGYLVVNDVSVRDWQLATPTMTLGKSWDTHGVIGPWVTTADEIEDPHALRVRTWVNDAIRQDGTTADLLTQIDELVAHVSTVCTLEPGDIIATGTPAGVGHAMSPPRYLRDGDTVRIEISSLGSIVNPVGDEVDDKPWLDSEPSVSRAMA